MQTGEAAGLRDGVRHRDGRRLPVPVPQQAALSHAARVHVPQGYGAV